MAAAGLGFEHAVGEGEDLRGGAVVGLDPVDHGPRMAVGEGHDILKIGPAPRVDALGIVAYGHDAVVGAHAVHDLRLERVRILILVDQDVPEAGGEIRRDVGRLDQQVEPQFQQVVVVEHVLLAFTSGVGGGKDRQAVGDLLVLREVARHGLGEIEPGVSGEGEDVVERAGLGVGLVLEEEFILCLDGQFQQRLGVIGVEDGGVFRQAHGIAIHAQDAGADGVEGAAPKAAGFDAGQLLDAGEHFLRGLVGEGQQKDLAGADAHGEQVGDPVSEGACLAGAGAGEDEQRAGFGGDGVELLVV